MTDGAPGFLTLATSSGVVVRALKVALVVGTILALINHADAVAAGTFSGKNLIQVVLTYLVPYGVATYSAVNALQDNFRNNR